MDAEELTRAQEAYALENLNTHLVVIDANLRVQTRPRLRGYSLFSHLAEPYAKSVTTELREAAARRGNRAGVSGAQLSNTADTWFFDEHVPSKL